MALDRATVIGHATQQVVSTLLADPVVDRLRTVGRILQLADRVGAVRLEVACARATRYDAVSHRAIKAISPRASTTSHRPHCCHRPPRPTCGMPTICWGTCLAVCHGTNAPVERATQAAPAVGHGGNAGRPHAPSGGWGTTRSFLRG